MFCLIMFRLLGSKGSPCYFLVGFMPKIKQRMFRLLGSSFGRCGVRVYGLKRCSQTPCSPALAKVPFSAPIAACFCAKVLRPHELVTHVHDGGAGGGGGARLLGPSWNVLGLTSDQSASQTLPHRAPQVFVRASRCFSGVTRHLPHSGSL